MDEDKKPAETENSAAPTPSPTQPSTSLDQPVEGSEGGGEAAPASNASPIDSNPATDSEPVKKVGGLKAFIRKVNIYLLGFILLLVLAGFLAAISFFNSKKTPPAPNIVNQNLTQDQLKQLANSNATIGDTGQTLTIQGSAIVTGQELVRGDLNVAGSLKLGGDISVQNFTAAGTVNLAATQIQTLQVANGSTLKGPVTIQNDLTVGGAASFNQPITANQLTVTNLIMSGNAQLRVPNHIAFTGASPRRQSVGSGALGSGGSASINGSDTTGTVNVNTGGGTSPGCFITVGFNKPFTSTPHVLITPINEGAGQTDYYVTRNTTSFSICTHNAAPTHKNFAFDYFITG